MAYYPTIEREIVGRGIKNTIIHIYEVSGDIDCGGAGHSVRRTGI